MCDPKPGSCKYVCLYGYKLPYPYERSTRQVPPSNRLHSNACTCDAQALSTQFPDRPCCSHRLLKFRALPHSNLFLGKGCGKVLSSAGQYVTGFCSMHVKEPFSLAWSYTACACSRSPPALCCVSWKLGQLSTSQSHESHRTYSQAKTSCLCCGKILLSTCACHPTCRTAIQSRTSLPSQQQVQPRAMLLTSTFVCAPTWTATRSHPTAGRTNLRAVPSSAQLTNSPAQ